jgi:hypothetical protein
MATEVERLPFAGLTVSGLIGEARRWPAVDGDALSASYVDELLNAMADRLEALAKSQQGTDEVTEAIDAD